MDVISSLAFVNSLVKFSCVKCFFSPVMIIVAFGLVTLLSSSSVSAEFGVFWISVNASVWVKAFVLKGVWSASARMRLVFLVALVFACLSRAGLVSMPIVCLVFLAMCVKSIPVPHPASRMTACFIEGRFSRAAWIFVSCSSLYCLS